MDGHESHHHIEFVELARADRIILVELPSKTSNWTQPFDRTVFNSLKSNWNSNIYDFLSETGVSVGHAQFFRMLNKSWTSSMTVPNVVSGFSATGIFPYRPGAIPNEAYEPSELYTQSETNTDTMTPENQPPSIINIELTPPQDNEVVDLPLTLDTNGKLSVLEATTSTEAVLLPEDTVVQELTEDLTHGVAETVDATEPVPSGSFGGDSKTMYECTADMALRVVESALTDEMKRKYMHAYDNGLLT